VIPPNVNDVVALRMCVSWEVDDQLHDANGHVNVRHHFDFHLQSIAALYDELGLRTLDSPERGTGMFMAASHVEYYSEVVAGDMVTAHAHLLANSARSVHGISYLVDRTSGRVANTFEFVAVNVDLATRRAVRVAAEVHDALEREVAATAALPWPLPVSGSLGLRTARH